MASCGWKFNFENEEKVNQRRRVKDNTELIGCCERNSNSQTVLKANATSCTQLFMFIAFFAQKLQKVLFRWLTDQTKEAETEKHAVLENFEWNLCVYFESKLQNVLGGLFHARKKLSQNKIPKVSKEQFRKFREKTENTHESIDDILFGFIEWQPP